MKKENLIAQLEGAKALSSQVDIDKVIALLQQLEPENAFGITQHLADRISAAIYQTLDYNSAELVDKDSACLELGYDNRVEVTEVAVDLDKISDHIDAVLSEFVIAEAHEEHPE